MKRLWQTACLLILVAVFLASGCAGHPRGMERPRWLTDKEKEKAIEIALSTPEVVATGENYDVYTTDFSWVAIVWRARHAAEIYGFDYGMVDSIPDSIPQSAELYLRVEIYLGEPEQVLVGVAVNPDTGEVAHVATHGLKTPPLLSGKK